MRGPINQSVDQVKSLSSPFLSHSIILCFPSENLSLTPKVKLARETEEASARKRKSVEGSSAAAASSGCDYDESQPQKKIPMMVDAFSAPSTSNTNPSPEPSFVPSLEYHTFGFNDDSIQGIEKQMTLGDKVNLSRLNVRHDDKTENPQYDTSGIYGSPTRVTLGCDNYFLTPKDRIFSLDDCYSSGDDSALNDDYMQGIKKPFVSEKEPLSALAAEFERNSIFSKKIEFLGEKYTALRRTRGDGNCFYRSFMFSYLEHILVTQNRAEMERVTFCIEKCRMDLHSFGYPESTFEDFFSLFKELLKNCLPGSETSLSLTDLLGKACHQMTSDCAVMFLRFVSSAAIQKRAQFFEPFVGLTHTSVVQFCKLCVEPMGTKSDNVHIIGLCDALGVPIRVAYLDAHSSGNPANPNAPNLLDFFPHNQEEVQNNGSNSTDAANVSTDLSKEENPAPFITLLYRSGHYDILYPM